MSASIPLGRLEGSTGRNGHFRAMREKRRDATACRSSPAENEYLHTRGVTPRDSLQGLNQAFPVDIPPDNSSRTVKDRIHGTRYP
jgi:hypothetical protein